MFERFPDVIDVKELCEMLCISKKTAYRLLNDDQIPYRKIGRIYRIRKRDVITFMTSRRNGQ